MDVVEYDGGGAGLGERLRALGAGQVDHEGWHAGRLGQRRGRRGQLPAASGTVDGEDLPEADRAPELIGDVGNRM
ncbi:hypothetical protein, partial [Pseudonocardia oceani]|uniref:hypothetical protein n=1 Tax=Pseudonocardia oceani TaxID=2792013 RepID=UPI001C49EA28